MQAALTVEGKVANLDLIYAGSYLKRDVDTESDYSDYSYWYDLHSSYGDFWYDDNGDLIDPSQYIQGKDRYNRYTHELRVASDPSNRYRFVGGSVLPAAGARHPAALQDRRPRLADQRDRLGRHDLADQAAARRQGPGAVRRVHVRLHRPADRHAGRALLRVRQLAEGLLRLQRRLRQQHVLWRGLLQFAAAAAEHVQWRALQGLRQNHDGRWRHPDA